MSKSDRRAWPLESPGNGGFWRGRLLYLRHVLSANLWLIPGLCLLTAVVLALVTVQLDRHLVGEWLHRQTWFPQLSLESARSALATIAASVITVASLVFSLTFIALTIASQQLGPRLISRAMRDSVNQVVLGTFVGTFIYTLLVLSAVNANVPSSPVPYCSIAIVFALVLLSFSLLLLFMHHTAMSIQADSVLAWLAETLDEAIDNIFPAHDPSEADDHGEIPPPAGDDAKLRAVPAVLSGYVQVVDRAALLEIATENDLLIRLDCRAGHFITGGMPLAHVAPRERATDDLLEFMREGFVIGPARTPSQDFEFEMRAIVDVGVRALSPSLNDYHTAMAALDWIGAAAARIMERDLPTSTLRDDDGKLRVCLYPVTFGRVLSTGFQQLMQAARGNQVVTVHLLVVLTGLATLARTEEQKRALRATGETAIAMADALECVGPERDELAERLDALRSALAA